VASNKVSRLIAETYQARFGLSVWEWRIIAVLGEEGGGAGRTAQSLVEATAMDKVTVSRAVRGLVDRSLLRRDKHASDGRASLLRLTDEGQGVYAEIAPMAIKVERELIDGLNAQELDGLAVLLRRLEARAETMTEPR
jgi:DNA-binding MarR family transcriptional regulator